MQRLGYRPQLTGVRAVAIGLVVWQHAIRHHRYFAGGFLGVDVFFVLSGFLITSLIVDEHGRTGTVDLAAFWRRRVYRLVPALTVMLAGVTIVYATVGDPRLIHRVESDIAAMLFVSNLVHIAGFTSSYGHLWSLGVEEQFYLAWPPVLALVVLRRKLRSPVRLILAATAAIAAVRIGAALVHIDNGDNRYDSIFVGCAAAFAWRNTRVKAIAGRPAVAAAALTVAALICAAARPAYIGDGLTIPFSLAVAVLLLCTLEQPRLARPLALAPVQWIGLISYSLYLWHLPAIWFARGHHQPVWAAVAVSVILACGSYLLVERPFLRRKERQRPRRIPATEIPTADPVGTITV